jgi:hypothetical protein
MTTTDGLCGVCENARRNGRATPARRGSDPVCSGAGIPEAADEPRLMPFRYRLIDADGSDVGPLVSKRDDWKPGDRRGRRDEGMLIAAVIEAEDDVVSTKLFDTYRNRMRSCMLARSTAPPASRLSPSAPVTQLRTLCTPAGGERLLCMRTCQILAPRQTSPRLQATPHCCAT